MSCETIRELVSAGDLYSARRAALTAPALTHEPFSFISSSSQRSILDDATATACALVWVGAVDELLAQPDHLDIIDGAHRGRHPAPVQSLSGVSTSTCFATDDEKAGCPGQPTTSPIT